MDKIEVLAIGATGVTATEIATPILQTADVSSVVQVVVQILIGIATLIGLFKKNKNQ